MGGRHGLINALIIISLVGIIFSFLIMRGTLLTVETFFFFILLCLFVTVSTTPRSNPMKLIYAAIFFGLSLINATVLFLLLKNGALLALTAFDACGFILSVFSVRPRPAAIDAAQTRISDFAPREKKRMIEKELRGSTREEKPRIEIIHEEPAPARKQTLAEAVREAVQPPKAPEKREQKTVHLYYFASKKSKRFHVKDCKHLKRIEEGNTLGFKTKRDARKAGFLACACVK